MDDPSWLARLFGGQSSMKRQNALTPITWQSGVAGGSFLTAAVNVPDGSVAQWVLIGGAVVSFGVALWAAVYFVRHDPSRLQSEHHNLEAKRLDMIGSKGEGFSVLPVSIRETPRVVESPHLPAIGPANDADEPAEGGDDAKH